MQRVKAESKTASGIFLPESSVKELNEANVLAVGPGAVDKEGKRIPMSVGVGDKVLIPQVWLMELSKYKLGQAADIDVFAVWRQPCEGRRGGVFAV